MNLSDTHWPTFDPEIGWYGQGRGHQGRQSAGRDRRRSGAMTPQERGVVLVACLGLVFTGTLVGIGLAAGRPWALLAGVFGFGVVTGALAVYLAVKSL